MNYQIGETRFEITASEKNLRVITGDELKFGHHVAKVIKNASHILGEDWLTTMVHPCLLYGNSIWHPR